jgi:hypothetical protein
MTCSAADGAGNIFTPTLWEVAFAGDRTQEPVPTVGLLLLLKTLQRLGNFVRLDAIPASIVPHISKAAGCETARRIVSLRCQHSETSSHGPGPFLAGSNTVRPRGNS